ncbi:MAG: DUF262 domain-containing protein [Proteobacteria bacterium]|nr:DUF262 domain-containing protein [Pseudomonadota bacterium]
MKNQTTTIRKITKQLNQPDVTDGGFWLPNIQRNFVWKEEQTERLFDSLMRDYPIGTLLVWKTKSKIRHRKFIDNYKDDTSFVEFYVPENSECKLLILDGQQRLQSLFIGLCGSYNGKELYFDILSGSITPPEDIKYIFKFKKTPATDTWIKLKDIVFGGQDIYSVQKNIMDSLQTEITEAEKMQIGKNISTIHQVFKTEERIVYQEFDSVDQPELYSDDDVVEIFIRANAGGTPLGKSDILFSLLTSAWEEAEEKMENLLEDLNKEGYAFTRDFVLKTCLTILNTGASYKVEKFRNPGVKEKIINEWDKIENSIKSVKDFLYGQTYLRSKKALKSYLTLIPIIYFHYHNKNKWDSLKNLDHYILKTLLAGSFGGSPDSLIDNCISDIKESKEFSNKRIFSVIRSSGRSLEISKNELLKQNYSKSNDLHLLFNMWYKNINYNPSYSGNELSIDHIFPTSILRKIKLESNTRIMRYKQEDRDQIANLMLLTIEENGAGGKSDIEPSEWFKDKSEKYLKRHLIPNNPELWKVENFGEFITERKRLITDKFRGELGVLIREKRNN